MLLMNVSLARGKSGNHSPPASALFLNVQLMKEAVTNSRAS